MGIAEHHRTTVTASPATVADLAGPLRARVDELTDRLVAQILASDPIYRDTAIPPEELRSSCLASLDQMVTKLIDPAARTLDYLTFLTGVGRRRVDQGVPLESLLHAYRIGARLIWDALREEAARQGYGEAPVLVEAATQVWQLHEASSSRVADAYRDAELERVRRRHEQRCLLVDGLLEGRGAEPAFARDAATALRLRPNGRHAVVIVAADGPETGEGGYPAEELEHRLAAHGLQSAWRPQPTGQLGIVDLGDAAIETVCRALRGVRARAGISAVVDGLDELPMARTLAATALATVPAGRTEVAVLTERLPAALLVSSPQLMALLVDHVLGPVLSLPDGERVQLLEALRAYADAGSCAKEAAAILHCHRNTVIKRLRRYERLTGTSLAEPAAMLAVTLALKAHPLLP
jgi:hypothetical protein